MSYKYMPVSYTYILSIHREVWFIYNTNYTAFAAEINTNMKCVIYEDSWAFLSARRVSKAAVSCSSCASVDASHTYEKERIPRMYARRGAELAERIPTCR